MEDMNRGLPSFRCAAGYKDSYSILRQSHLTTVITLITSPDMKSNSGLPRDMYRYPSLYYLTIVELIQLLLCTFIKMVLRNDDLDSKLNIPLLTNHKEELFFKKQNFQHPFTSGMLIPAQTKPNPLNHLLSMEANVQLLLGNSRSVTKASLRCSVAITNSTISIYLRIRISTKSLKYREGISNPYLIHALKQIVTKLVELGAKVSD